LTEPSTVKHPLPAPPRPITRRVRARSWAEAPVRVWSILTILIIVTIIYLAAQNVMDGVIDHRLIHHGTQVTAKIVEVSGTGDPRRTVATHGSTEDRTVKLTYPGGPDDGSTRALETARYEGKRPGDEIQVRFDPSNPELWTDRTQTQPWTARMAIVWMLLPPLAISLLMLLWRRQQILGLWRNGSVMSASVVDSKQSAIAPRSRVVRFILNDSEDRRVLSSFYPNHAASMEKGDDLLILAPPTNPSRAIVARLYEEELNR
jgi:hypothetical protein